MLTNLSNIRCCNIHRLIRLTYFNILIDQYQDNSIIYIFTGYSNRFKGLTGKIDLKILLDFVTVANLDQIGHFWFLNFLISNTFFAS